MTRTIKVLQKAWQGWRQGEELGEGSKHDVQRKY